MTVILHAAPSMLLLMCCLLPVHSGDGSSVRLGRVRTLVLYDLPSDYEAWSVSLPPTEHCAAEGRQLVARQVRSRCGGTARRCGKDSDDRRIASRTAAAFSGGGTPDGQRRLALHASRSAVAVECRVGSRLEPCRPVT
jgi:hypothetical protein